MGSTSSLTEEEIEEYERKIENLYQKPTELWIALCEHEYPEVGFVDLDKKQKEFLEDFYSRFNTAEGCYVIIRKSIEHWDCFCEFMQKNGMATAFIPKRPSVSFFYAHRKLTKNFLLHIIKKTGCEKEEVLKYVGAA